MKNHPLVFFFVVFRLSKYENTNEHVLVRARKIHESVLCQAFFCLFFEISKTEEGLEFAFLDSIVRRMHTNSRNLMKVVSSLKKVGEVWPWGQA